MSIKRIIAAGGVSLMALSSILTPAAFANYDHNHNSNNNRDWRYFQELKACVRTLNDNRMYWNDMNNNWNNNNYWNGNWNHNRPDRNTRQNLRLCIRILNNRHNWNDHNYWNNWYHNSNQSNWNDRRNW